MPEATTGRKPFRMLFADEHNELFRYLIQNPLLWSIFTVCAIRARWKDEPSPEGLHQGEFWLSSTEYWKFGLNESQHGQISRKLLKLCRLHLIVKTGRKIGSDGAMVYRFTSNTLIDINIETGSEIGSEQASSRKGIGTNNNVNNVKSDKGNIAKSQIKNYERKSLPYRKNSDFFDFENLRKGFSLCVKDF